MRHQESRPRRTTTWVKTRLYALTGSMIGRKGAVVLPKTRIETLWIATQAMTHRPLGGRRQDRDLCKHLASSVGQQSGLQSLLLPRLDGSFLHWHCLEHMLLQAFETRKEISPHSRLYESSQGTSHGAVELIRLPKHLVSLDLLIRGSVSSIMAMYESPMRQE